jgi:hypothetical protein
MRSPERMRAARGHGSGIRRRGRLAIAAGCILWLAASRAVAQCALCGSGTPYAGRSPGQAYATLAAAALVLLVPVLGLIVALATVLRKYRD